MEKNRRKRIGVGILLCLLTVYGSISSIRAQEATSTVFQELQKRLVGDGFDQKEMAVLYKHPRVSFDTKRVSLFLMHTEATLNYDQFASKRSIRKARKYMETHKAELTHAERTYGVDPEVITAIILVETRLGTGTGRSSVINILSTMAALSDPKVREQFWSAVSGKVDVTKKEYDAWAVRKSEWAYGELKAFLKYTEREKMDPVQIKGSYAGAVGISQFMPTNILIFARDGNNDGRVNLFDHSDAIASAAHYLKRHGWKPGIDRKKASKVIWTYNHSKYYVETILKISELLKG